MLAAAYRAMIQAIQYRVPAIVIRHLPGATSLANSY